MANNNLDNHKTPPKFLENFALDIREEMHKKNPAHSPFKCMPNISTPPSQFFKIKNPFEASINERLHLHIFSPSVFTEVKRTSENFKWTIDDLSSLRPAPIDVSTVHQFEQSNTEDDVTVQAKIEKYFSETHTVPSPWNEDAKTEPLLTETSPCNNDTPKEVCDGWTQTVLTLPPILPATVEEALKPYFTFTQEQGQDDRNNSLCRRLFHFQEEESNHESVSSIQSELSVLGSPVIGVPSKLGRNFDTSPLEPPSPSKISPISNSTPRRLSQCQFSPISSRLDTQLRSTIHEKSLHDDILSPITLRHLRKSKSASRLDFSGHMSVDTSFNMVPENDMPDEHDKTSLSESPLRTNEYMENSCNWDMEYNNLSLNGRSIRKNLFTTYKRSSSESSMEISSQHLTPKSIKSYPNQRKKLSDSFKLFDSDEEEEKEEYNQSKQMRFHLNEDCKTTKNDIEYLSQNTQDTGYNTCSELSQRTTSSRHEEDMLVSDISSINDNKENWNLNIFASTPTKTFFKDIVY